MSHFDRPPRFSGALAKIYAAAFMLFAVAFGARIVWWLMEPYLWMVFTIVALGGIYWVIFRGFRR